MKEHQETSAERSAIMARVKSIDTKPEMIVRRLTFRLGYRYRLHDSRLPGKPDLVFPGKRKVIFVHGCYWHGHDCRAGRNRPASNVGYWTRKLTRNCERDKENQQLLKKSGWSCLILWECELKSSEEIERRLRKFLDS
ncbi:MAG: very short patch repair endonuclease [Blastocatellia bacterium]|nr:very short patch repair endonuclease [Blastocatellia bacterium]